MSTAQVNNSAEAIQSFSGELLMGTGSDLRGISSTMLHGKRYNFHVITSQRLTGVEKRYGCTVGVTDYFLTVRVDGSHIYLKRGFNGRFTNSSKLDGHKAIINYFNL